MHGVKRMPHRRTDMSWLKYPFPGLRRLQCVTRRLCSSACQQGRPNFAAHLLSDSCLHAHAMPAWQLLFQETAWLPADYLYNAQAVRSWAA